MENNSDTEYDNMDLENHPLIRLMMRSIQMIPTNENDILQSTFDEQNIKSIPTCNKFIENLNEMYITEDDVKNGLSCSICQEEFKLNDKCIELPCKPHKHYFHIKNENCDGVLPWLSENNTCPMCRCEFPKSEEQTDTDQSNRPSEEPTGEPTEEQPPLPNIEEILLQAINRRNNVNIISSNPNETNMLPDLLFPNIAVDTVRDGFSDREVDEAIRRSLES
jgi:E3 ubiquitin-protein ligase RNF115/126